QDNLGGGKATATTAADGSFASLSVSAKTGEDLTFVAGTRSLALDAAIRLFFTEPFKTDDASINAFKAPATLSDADAPANNPLTYDLVPETTAANESRGFRIVPLTAFSPGHHLTLHLAGGASGLIAANSKTLPISLDIEMFTPKANLIGSRAVNNVDALYL